ncbi:FtsX-like permease family protein [Jannaschia seohaensis]|uniref:Putative ABC transport system permease protein n=1 Tax=Jannaschia seohaensis TaxID=475081 RepID=A0A2Y9A333_9RHOB|nr:ABC transporter permease [Jannaschia seohaensis]PWJ22337.1 putative ABC transport system permease protein [Jannaschia seohaensis]SSA38615.1 putative ABC transport system permease protein [Jannaschia seohaensis]
MTRAALQALWSHWRRHPLQLLTLVVGLALATGLWTGVQAINAQARLSYDQAAATLGQDRLPRLEGDLTLADFAAARRGGWIVSPVLEDRLPGTGLTLYGIDPFTLPPTPGGVMPDLSDPGVLRAFLAGELVFAAAATLPRVPDTLPEGRVLEGLAPGLVMADLTAARRWLGAEGITRLLFDGGPGTPEALAETLGARVERPESDGDLARLTDSFHLNLTAFGLLAFVVGLFIVHATIGLAFEQRRTLFRTLRALGLPQRRLGWLLAGELLAFTLVSGTLGVVLGYAVAAALLPGVAATLSGLYGAGVAGSLTLSPLWWLSGFAMAGLGMAVAGAASLRRLATLPILAPAMPRAWARAQRRTVARQGWAGLGLLAVSAFIAALGDGLIAGFATLGALLLGAALLLPPVLLAVLDAGTALAKGAVAQWLWADTRQQVPGLSLALMALLLALAANIGVGTMVGSFRATFEGWLDQRLASELYVTARSEAQADEIAAFLAPRTEAVLPIVSAEADLAGAPGEVYGVADHSTYRENWPLLDALPQVWDRLAAGEGVLVNEQLARREDLWPGTRLTLAATGPLPVLGVYSDYGNTRGQAILGLATFEAAYPEARRLRFGVRIAPGEADALADILADRFDLSAEQVVPQATIKQFSLDVFERTFAVTAALNVLTLGVAGFALWASLTTLGTMRLPQVAPVWALGLTRAELALADLGRAVLLGLLTALVAVPVGIALAWVLLAVVNVQAFGWRLPLLPDPGGWVALGGWTLIASALAAALPALRLWRMPPAEMVKVFAHER